MSGLSISNYNKHNNAIKNETVSPEPVSFYFVSNYKDYMDLSVSQNEGMKSRKMENNSSLPISIIKHMNPLRIGLVNTSKLPYTNAPNPKPVLESNAAAPLRVVSKSRFWRDRIKAAIK